MMKRFLASAFFMVVAIHLMAQKPSLNKAYNAFFEKDFVAAKEQIDLCVTDEKLKEKAQTFLYKGNIYFYLANDEYEKVRHNSAYISQYPDAAIEAFDAFTKAKEMNKNVDAYEMLSPDTALSKIYPLLFVRGADLLVEGNHQQAIPILERAVKSYEMIPNRGVLEGELYYYYGYALEMDKKMEEARQYYEKSMADGSNNVNVYIRLLEVYKAENNNAKIDEILQLANQKFPNDPLLYVSNVSHLYAINDTLKARQLLKNIPPQAYTDATSLVNISNFYVQDKDYKNGYDLLRRALSLDPKNFNVNYNLGVCAYYMAQDLFMKANELEVANKKEEAAPITAEANALITEAERYFEYVLTIEPNDINILQALKSIYARTMSPKFDEVDKKLKSLE